MKLFLNIYNMIIYSATDNLAPFFILMTTLCYTFGTLSTSRTLVVKSWSRMKIVFPFSSEKLNSELKETAALKYRYITPADD